MRPRNFSARVVLILGVVMLSVIFITFTDRAVATQAGLLAYCASTPDQSDIYITQVFNTGLDPAVSQDSNPIQNEYNEYLKGRFEFKSNSNFPVTCRLFLTMSEAQSGKQNYEMQMRNGNKQRSRVGVELQAGAGYRDCGDCSDSATQNAQSKYSAGRPHLLYLRRISEHSLCNRSGRYAAARRNVRLGQWIHRLSQRKVLIPGARLLQHGYA